MDRSILFYTGLLGLQLVMDLDVEDEPKLDRVVGMEGVRGRVVFLDAGDSRVELWYYKHPEGQPLPEAYRPADLGVSHLAFEVGDVEAVHQALSAAGFHVTTLPEDLGIHRTFYARGPDGEFLELLEDRSDLAMLTRVTARNASRRQQRLAEGPPGR